MTQGAHKVLVRVDGSRAIGHGHVFRTLVLADALHRRGAAVAFLCRDLEGAPLGRIERSPHELIVLEPALAEEAEADAVLAEAEARQATWLVVDRYASTPDFYRAVRARGVRVLAIDDIAEHPFPVDLLLNQNPDAERLAYAVEPETTKLFGPDYALLAARYVAARPAAPPRCERAQHVLISFGGTDAGNATGLVLEALERIGARRLSIDVVAGSASANAQELARQAAASRHQVRLQRDLDDLVDVMCAADVFIGAGGTTSWEACCLGLPLALLPIADNQLGLVAGLERRDVALNLGQAAQTDAVRVAERLRPWLDSSSDALASQAARAWQLIDGRGAERVAEQLLGHSTDGT